MWPIKVNHPITKPVKYQIFIQQVQRLIVSQLLWQIFNFNVYSIGKIATPYNLVACCYT